MTTGSADSAGIAAAPEFDNRFFCIVDRENVELAAVISSYVSRVGTYTPVVTFPGVADTYREGAAFDDDDYIGNVIGSEAATFVNNALAHAGGCNYLLLAGLTKDQKSYIHSAGRAKVIEIQDLSEVAEKLASTGLPTGVALRCRSDQLLLGLLLAIRSGRILEIDGTADDLRDGHRGAGIVVIEQKPKNASTVIAVNYATAIDATVAFVPPLSDSEPRAVLDLIQQWRVKSDSAAHGTLLGMIGERIDNIDFNGYGYVTFFTDGLPYSVDLGNAIPCSYVNLSLRADLFVLNNIVAERAPAITAAVVFSLDEFFADGESEWLVKFLSNEQYYVRSLSGPAATVSAFDYNAQHFSYSLLHISSHGGEVEGYASSQEFVDRNGKKHVVEYDEVVAFSPVPNSDLVEVLRKLIFRTFDGLVWRSEELRAKKIPHSVFDDMRKAILDKERMGEAVRKYKSQIPASCGVQCARGFHQGMFQMLASHGSPLVFNNTCWSWSDVAQFFITGGARAYVGTLWSIQNDSAILGAKEFYKHAMTSTFLESSHAALSTLAGTVDKDVYVFWGLHFARMPKGIGVAASGSAAFHELVNALFRWIEQAGATKSAEVRKNAVDVVTKLLEDINSNFNVVNATELNREIAQAMIDASATPHHFRHLIDAPFVSCNLQRISCTTRRPSQSKPS